jgi:hypothetical protein
MRRRYYRVQPEGARVVDRALRHLEAMATGLRPEIARLAGEGPGKD